MFSKYDSMIVFLRFYFATAPKRLTGAYWEASDGSGLNVEGISRADFSSVKFNSRKWRMGGPTYNSWELTVVLSRTVWKWRSKEMPFFFSTSVSTKQTARTRVLVIYFIILRSFISFYHSTSPVFWSRFRYIFIFTYWSHWNIKTFRSLRTCGLVFFVISTFIRFFLYSALSGILFNSIYLFPSPFIFVVRVNFFADIYVYMS